MIGGGVDRDGPGRGDVSLFDIASILLRSRWRVFRWMFVGAVLAVLPILFREATYTSTASFISHGAPDQGRAGLASLAGQFGLAVSSGGSPAESPQFYAYLLQSRAILAPIAADSFAVPELENDRQPLLDLLGVEGNSTAARLEEGINALSDIVATSIGRETGVLTVSVETPWPSLSYTLTDRLLAGLNNFNLQTRQGQASEERRFAEERLAEARTALRAAEDGLQLFHQRNRGFSNSPELLLERDRLEREVGAEQQIVTSLAEAYEEARIREVRDTPVLTVIEEPAVPTRPNARGRVRRAVMGAILGGALAAFVLLIHEGLRRKRQAGDPEAEDFLVALRDIKPQFPTLRSRRKPSAEEG